MSIHDNTFLKHNHKNNKSLSGVFFMLLHAICMSILYIFSKNLTQVIHPFQLAFLYKFTILLAIIPWCFLGNFKKDMSTKKIGMHIARGTFSLLGTVCFFIAVSNLPVTNAAAITYLDHIIVIMIGIFYFKEKLTKPKIALIFLSSIGAMLIVKPGITIFNKYYIYLFLALIFWALNCTVIKILGTTERTKAQLFYMMLFSTMFSLPFALYEWKTLELWQLKYILGIALCYLIHSIAFFKAFKFADMTTVMPFDYSRLIFTGILGYMFLSEAPDTFSLAGYALIFIGGMISILYETRKNKRINSVQKAALLTEHEST